MTPRERVQSTLNHHEPDRVPVDFVATPEVWDRLIAHLAPDVAGGAGLAEYLDPAREAVLRTLDVDIRILSYDMFCKPPASIMQRGSQVDWWTSLDRSTPNRMWRQRDPDGTNYDIWGAHRQKVAHEFGAYEEFADWPLQHAESVNDLEAHPWPEPEWWDFSPLPDIVRQLDAHDEYSIRFRVGSVFEIAWQLRGMQEFLMDLVINPDIPRYLMTRITDVHVENLRTVLELIGDRLDMIYFYDDVATQNSLLISPETWHAEVKPLHTRLIELAHAHDVAVMYHCDGAIYPLIPDLIKMGVDVLNPIQPDAKNMNPARLKEEFGSRITFHGGIDIAELLPHGTREEVAAAVQRAIDALGQDGGYILCSAHHIQSDTPVANVLTMYDPDLRYLSTRAEHRRLKDEYVGPMDS